MGTVWDTPDALIWEAIASYGRPDGTRLRVPYADVVRHRDGLFIEYRFNIDTKPAWAS